MLVDPDKYPSFCKLLFKEGFMDKILMPPLFIKEHKMMLAKTCILKMEEGMSWEAKIVKQESNFFISGGDWPQFVAYHKLELGDILLFFLVDKSKFLVLPYQKKCCRGQHVFEELSGNSSEEEGDVGSLRALKKVKMTEELLDSKNEMVDPSCGTKDGQNPCYSHSDVQEIGGFDVGGDRKPLDPEMMKGMYGGEGQQQGDDDMKDDQHDTPESVAQPIASIGIGRRTAVCWQFMEEIPGENRKNHKEAIRGTVLDKESSGDAPTPGMRQAQLRGGTQQQGDDDMEDDQHDTPESVAQPTASIGFGRRTAVCWQFMEEIPGENRVRCILCPPSARTWAFHGGKGGSTSNFNSHLQKNHKEAIRGTVLDKESTGDAPTPGMRQAQLRGGLFDDKADNMLEAEEKAPGQKGLEQRHDKDLDKPKSPESAIFVEQGRDPDQPNRPALLEEFRTQLNEENPSNKSVSSVAKAGEDKLKQLSDAEKPMVEYVENMDTYNKQIAAGSAEGSNKWIELLAYEGEYNFEDESSSDFEQYSCNAHSEYDVSGDVHIKESGGRSRRRKRRSKSDENKTIMVKERCKAYQRAQEHASTSVTNPSTICFMYPSYICEDVDGYSLCLQSAFVKTNLGEKCSNIQLRVRDKEGSWPIKCNMSKIGKFKLCAGWRAFVVANELKVGDVCLFEVVKSTDEPVLEVTIFREAEEHALQPEINNNIPDEPVINNNIPDEPVLEVTIFREAEEHANTAEIITT